MGGANHTQVVRRLVLAVALAAHDVELETDEAVPYRILHFLDTDFLHRATFGYQAVSLDAVQPTRDFLSSATVDDLVGDVAVRGTRAESNPFQLLLSGLVNFAASGSSPLVLPELRILKPHLPEWTKRLENPPRPAGRETRERVLRQLGVADAFAELAPQQSADDASAVRLYVRSLESIAPELMIAHDLTALNHGQRALNLMNAGLRRSTPFDYPAESLLSAEFRRIEATLRKIRFPSGSVVEKSRARSHMNDVAATAILTRAVRERPVEDERIAILRFYTETGALRRALWSDSWLAPLCRYQPTHDHAQWPPESHSVLRDEFYYILRFLVPSLAFGRERGNDRNGLIESVKTIAQSAIEARSSADVYSVLSRLEQVDGDLTQIIDGIADLNFVRDVWPAWSRATMSWFEQVLSRGDRKALDSVVEFEEQHGQGIRDEVAVRVRELESRSRDIAHFLENYVRFAAHLRNNIGRARQIAESDDVLADSVGLFRLAVRPSEALTDALGESMRSVLGSTVDGDGNTVETIAETLAGSLLGGGGVVRSETIATLAYSFVVRQFRIVADHADAVLANLESRIEDGERPLVSGIDDREWHTIVCGLAAIASFHYRCRTGPASGDENFVTLEASRASTYVARASEWNHEFANSPASVLLSAYLNFQAWYTLNQGIELIAPERRLDGEHAAHFREASRTSVAELRDEKGTWYRPWALNHLLYLESISFSGSEEDERSIQRLAAELLALKADDFGGHWSYRFADTLGYRSYLVAREILESMRSDWSDEAKSTAVSLLRDSLDHAQRWLVEASSVAPFDLEVARHVDLLQNLQNEVSVRLLPELRAGVFDGPNPG